MMASKKKLMQNLISILKDKTSLLKAAFSINRTASSIHLTILRATTHTTASPPPEHRLVAFLSLGRGPRATASTCIVSLMDRLHRTTTACVALKCLITIHHVISEGSFILRDQLCFYPSAGGRNFLNLSSFRDGRDAETWELSNWVRWYSCFLERNLIASRNLGVFISSKDEANLTALLNSDLMRAIDVLVGLIEEICRAPDSLNNQKSSLIYEVLRLVGKDYRWIQRRISIRLGEFSDRISELSNAELTQLMNLLRRLGECRERLQVVFANRVRNDSFWEFVTENVVALVKVKEERERGRWMVRTERKDETTRIGEPVAEPSRLLMLPYGGEWIGADHVRITAWPAMA